MALPVLSRSAVSSLPNELSLPKRHPTAWNTRFALFLPAGLPLEMLTVPKTNGLDVSLAMVPPNHPLLDHRLLEAEAAGLLDRMLAVLQDNSRSVMLCSH